MKARPRSVEKRKDKKTTATMTRGWVVIVGAREKDHFFTWKGEKNEKMVAGKKSEKLHFREGMVR